MNICLESLGFYVTEIKSSFKEARKVTLGSYLGEVNESTEKVVVREFWEELGFRVKVSRLFAIIENFNAYGYKFLHEFGMYYEVKSVEQLPHDLIQFEGVEETVKLTFKWIGVNEINQVKLYPKALHQLLTEMPTDVRHLINSDD